MKTKLPELFTSVPTGAGHPSQPWIIAQLDSILKFNDKHITKPANVPDVIGMGLKDAVYLLESNGFKVSVTGKGRVRSQKQMNINEIKLVLS